MLNVMYAAVALLLVMMGAAVFSFLNVVAYRYPRKLDYVRGRSMCTQCGHALAPADLVPVFGYIFLGGRCRYCKAHIPVRYLLCELLGGGLLLLSVWYFGAEYAKAIVTFAFLSVLFLIALIDIDTMEIPDGFVIALGVVAAVSCAAFSEITLLSRLIGFFDVSVPLFAIAWAIPGAFGGGDIKMMAACGAFLGWKLNLFALAMAILTGGIYGCYLLLTKKAQKGTHFAFGPFLCFGAALAVFAGEACISWYLGMFL